jgi:hypothetical protein
VSVLLIAGGRTVIAAVRKKDRRRNTDALPDCKEEMGLTRMLA